MGTLDLSALQIWGSLCLKSGVMNSSPLKSGSAEPSTVNDVNLQIGLWVCSVRWVKHGLEAANSFPQPTPAAGFIPGLYKMHHFKLNKCSAVANMFVWCYASSRTFPALKTPATLAGWRHELPAGLSVWSLTKVEAHFPPDCLHFVASVYRRSQGWRFGLLDGREKEPWCCAGRCRPTTSGTTIPIIHSCKMEGM